MKPAAGPIGGLVLAAGESRRMGRPKALLPFPGGTTFVDAVINALHRGGVGRIVVVLGHESEAVIRGARLQGATVAVNDRYREGQLSSVRRGLETLGSPAAMVVALVDQPQVRPRTIERLIAAFRQTGAPLVRPVWDNRGGHPVLLSAEAFPEIISSSTETLYDVVKKFHDRRCDVPADGSILTDFDVPADLARLEGPEPPAEKN